MGTCASCQGHTSEVMNFGDVALAGAFLKPSEFKGERKYPLSLEFCESCALVQIPQRVPPHEMFEDYFYFSSAIGTMRKHFALYASEIVERFAPETVVEIGCNDGVLLKPLADLGVRRLIGVDPAKNVTATIADPRIEVVSACFGAGAPGGRADVVIANNVFAHIADINAATAEVSRMIGDDGVFVFEVNRLDGLVSDNQYDWVYHEHLYYYSCISLESLLARHGMVIFDMKRLGTHAGSIRYYACGMGSKHAQAVTQAVDYQKRVEEWIGVNRVERLHKFAMRAEDHRDRLLEIVSNSVGRGEVVAGYGACGRANTMLQYAELGADDIAFIVDDAPAKHGFYTPGSHIPILPSSALERDPDKLIVFAWSFLPEIMDKCADFKGEIIVPLPDFYTVDARKAA